MTILCINLDSRPDRWAQASEEFKRVGLTVERFPAITGDNRPLAFNQSVYACMKIAKERGGDLLLLEDDVVFDGMRHIDLRELPEGFMTVHLGANIIGSDTTAWQMPTYYSVRFAKLHNCYQSHATIYSKECVDFILDNMRTDIMDEDNNIFDDWLRRKVLCQGRSYVMRPMVAYQRPSQSDIWSMWADYTGCHKQGNEYLNKVI
jgi:hypothetical protein